MESINNGSNVKKSMKKRHTCFDWIQLLATILIPIVITLYTIVDNKSNESIADANRLKDLEIAEANRLNEIELGEQSRQKDRELSIDQQQENILVEYQMFLSKLILEQGNNLKKSSEAKTVAQFMTLTALDQLNIKRKTILLRSLHHANLITLQPNNQSFKESIINLEQADLSHIQFGLKSNQTGKLPMYRYIAWHYLWLPHAILVNASFCYTLLDCSTFTESIMDSIDMSFATHTNRQCQTNFTGASLIKANMYNVRFHYTEFSSANLTMANMGIFECIECNFSSAILSKVNLSYSRILHNFRFYKYRLLFDNTNFSHAILQSAVLNSLNFTNSDWSNVRASQIGIYNCTFNKTMMENCSFFKSNIQDSIYENINLFRTDLSYTKFYNVTFINSNMRYVNMSYIQCEYCSFINVNFQDSIWLNITLRYSIFRDSYIDLNQLLNNTNDLLKSKFLNETHQINLGENEDSENVIYFIRIKTGDRIASETHMNVYLTIFGKINRTRETELKSSNYQLNKFQRGYIDNFTHVLNNLGQIKSIIIRYDENTYKTKWFLDWIEIEIPIRDEFYKFSCYCWINKSEINNHYAIELKPSEIINKNIMVTYEVTVYTGDTFGAGTDADIFLMIYGEYRDSKTYHLLGSNTNNDAFERNRKDVFEIKSLALGRLKKIEIWMTGLELASSWFLDRIEIRAEKTNQMYKIRTKTFQRISYDPDEIASYEIPAFGNSQIENKNMIKKRNVESFITYRIITVTSNKLGSETNANVYIVLFGKYSTTDKIPLVTSKTYEDPFESGRRDVFEMELIDIGELIKMKIGHDNTGFQPDWFLEHVEIDVPIWKQKWIFRCDQWLVKSKEEQEVDIELYPNIHQTYT